MRVQLRHQQRDSGVWWRLTEADGRLVCRWLPWEESLGPLDKGGFKEHGDALAFKLGIDWCRARARLLGDLTTGDIDLERLELDADRRGRSKAPMPVALLFEAA